MARTERIDIRVSPELKTKVAAVAKERGLTVSELLIDYLKRLPAPKKNADRGGASEQSEEHDQLTEEEIEANRKLAELEAVGLDYEARRRSPEQAAENKEPCRNVQRSPAPSMDAGQIRKGTIEIMMSIEADHKKSAAEYAKLRHSAEAMKDRAMRMAKESLREIAKEGGLFSG